MTSKFRVRAKVHRIKDTKVRRQRTSICNAKRVDDDGNMSSSSSEVSQDWDDFDEDEEGMNFCWIRDYET